MVSWLRLTRFFLDKAGKSMREQDGTMYGQRQDGVVSHCLLIAGNEPKLRGHAFRPVHSPPLGSRRPHPSSIGYKRPLFFSVVPTLGTKLSSEGVIQAQVTQSDRALGKARLLFTVKTVFSIQRNGSRRSHITRSTINALLEHQMAALLQLARDKTERRGP
jgi:hypothetical protein